MSRQLNDKEIEKLKERPSMADSSARGRLLAVQELLYSYTDETIGLSAHEIARVIGRCSGKEPTEVTVLEDIHTLAKLKPLGMEIALPKKGENIGFRCISRPFTSEEAIVLSNTVSTCAYINPEQKDTLQEKLEKLMSQNATDSMIETIIVDEREAYGASDVFETLRVAMKAIRSGQSMHFRYKYHLMNGEESVSRLHEIDPIAIILSNGHYYIEALKHDEENSDIDPLFYRVDHITDSSIFGSPVFNKELIRRLQANTSSTIKSKVDMYGEGPVRTLFLKVKGSHAKYVYDKFGHDLVFQHIDESDPKNVVGYACIQVQLSPTFFRWLFGMSEGITLCKPTQNTWLKAFRARQSLGGQSLVGLQNDYEIASHQFLSQISFLANADRTEESYEH